RKVGILKEHCAAVGRNPAEIVLSWQLRPDMDNLAAAVEEIKRFQEAGASHFVIVLPPPHTEGVATRIAEEVIGKIS
ncbi:MAG: hypothetical protein IT335_11190, partial [Thermomicrobiales bacterium]|nr:hypothetical protein [Thermomicrobiales bacterium]